jgi:hypothetical protein
MAPAGDGPGASAAALEAVAAGAVRSAETGVFEPGKRIVKFFEGFFPPLRF